jgi:hypothetical protein
MWGRAEQKEGKWARELRESTLMGKEVREEGVCGRRPMWKGVNRKFAKEAKGTDRGAGESPRTRAFGTVRGRR